MKKLSQHFIWGIIIVGISTFAIAAFAQDSDFSIISGKNEGGVLSANCINCGACSICDLMSLLSVTMRYLLGISGALALALFMWGAWSLLTSAGSPEKVESGKKVLTGTAIGLAIILLFSWAWPQWVIWALKGAPDKQDAPLTIFSNDGWWLTPCKENNKIGEEEAKACAEPTRSDVNVGNSSSECYDIVNGDYKPKTPGSDCNPGSGSTCICGENGRVLKSCGTYNDCSISNGGLYCSKPNGINAKGYCKEVSLGSVCDPNNLAIDGCPGEVVIGVTNIPIGTPFGALNIPLKDKAEVYCDTSKKCVIKQNSNCNSNVQQWCAPGTSCVNEKCVDTRKDTGGDCRGTCYTLCADPTKQNSIDCSSKPDTQCKSGTCNCWEASFVGDRFIGKCR